MFTIDEIARATGGTIIGSAGVEVSGVTTDSRTLKEGELFIPLKGDRFDGHDYLDGASASGAGACLVEDTWAESHPLPSPGTFIIVRDTLHALGDLAAFHRNRFAIPVVAVTGSNGKTTTKEMIATILDTTGPGLKTSGNLNNLIGLPQMLLRLTAGDRWAVLEMGMSEPGEIDRLAEIVRPDVGVITNAFAAHLESMGSIEAVARAKGELFLRLAPGGWAVFNADDPLIAAVPSPAGIKRLGFGFGEGAISADTISNKGLSGVSFTLRLPEGAFPLTLKAFGRHNIANALAAAAAAVALGVPGEIIRSGLEEFTPYDKRFKLEELEGVVLIDDSYNANPASMAAALTTLRDMKGSGRAIAVLGDMLELGPGSAEEHHTLGRLAASCVDRLCLLGASAGITAEGAREGGLSTDEILVAKSHEDIFADLAGRLGHGEFLLIKGSRGMKMEIVAEGIRQAYAPIRAEGAVA
jgi:UDP-N-acetylmuramoyl-tripeptide--D-alanyl-D-alanine ligase